MAVTLNECPTGLFLFQGDGAPCLGFKSEYRTVKQDRAGRTIGTQVDAYVVASGEYFWGGTVDWRKREELLVEPIDDDQLTPLLTPPRS